MGKIKQIWDGLTFMLICAFVVILFWATSAASWLDNKLFPVVTEFKVTTIVITDEGATLSGEMYKPAWREMCELNSVVATVNKTRQYKLFSSDDITVFTRSSGWSAFHEWFVPGKPINHITIVARHQCNRFWQNVTTVYDSEIPPVVTFAIEPTHPTGESK